MDISKLDIEHIRLFNLVHTIAKEAFSVAPVDATPKEQKKIRQWVTKTYLAGRVLPENVLEFINDSRSDADFIAFMAACANKMEEHNAQKRQLFEQVTADFSEDVKKAFLHLFETMVYCEVVEQQEGKIIFPLDPVYSYKRSLILHTSTENFLGEFYNLDFSDAQILKEGNGYKLTLLAENYNCDDPSPRVILFDNASVEIEVYRADRSTFSVTPWQTLTGIASDILEKCYLGDGYLNQKEQALLPLLKELRALSLWSPLYEEKIDFAILKQHIQKHNLPHLLPLLDKLAARKNAQKPFNPFLFSRLSNKLNDAVCENLWRELYALVAETQEGYIDATHSYSRRKFGKIKKQIEEAFHALGYEGSYPTFRKHGAIKGIRLEESYGQSYFVGPEKNVEYIVLCREHWHFETFRIQFLCGTALLKKDDSITDIYSCCFNKKGRRLFKNFYWEDGDISTLAQFAAIAAKKAECTKLAKEDKKLLGSDGVSWQYFLFEFLFAGGLFGIMMTTATFLILCLVTILTVGFGSLLEMIKTMPWLLFFAISLFGFGIPMAIVDAKAKTK